VQNIPGEQKKPAKDRQKIARPVDGKSGTWLHGPGWRHASGWLPIDAAL